MARFVETGMNLLSSYRNHENAMEPISKYKKYDSPRPVRRLVEAHGGQVG